MRLNNIFSKKIIAFFFVFIFSILYSQNEYKTFYNRMNAIYPNDRGVKKAKQEYLKIYEKTKNADYFAFTKIIDIIFIKPEDSVKNLRSAYKIISVAKPETAARAEGYYWTAVYLERSSLDLSQSFLKKAIKINQKNHNEYLLPINYHILGRNYYKRGDYINALVYYKKAMFYFIKQGELTHISSMYNNYGLAYAKMKNYSLAIKNAQKAINVLNSKKKIVYYEVVFLHSIISNLGNYYYEIGDFKKALNCYEKVFLFSRLNPPSKNNLSGILPKMFLLYKNNPKKLKDFTNSLPKLLDKDTNNPLNTEILKIFQQNALEKGSLNDIKQTTYRLNNYRDRFRLMLLKKQRQTNDDLNKYIIASLENEQYINNQKEQTKNIIIYFALTLLASGLFYFYKVNHLNKEKAKIKNDLLENEKKIMLERMEHLNLNLDLKSNTEKEFLSRLKKIKKEKNYNAEEIIKDLHLSISSLLNIDRKHEMEAQKKNILNENFLQKLAQDHPGLASQDLQLCGYIHLSLTNKEIALLQNLTPPSVRVYKTRLKAKLNLSKEQDLEFYLKTKYL